MSSAALDSPAENPTALPFRSASDGAPKGYSRPTRDEIRQAPMDEAPALSRLVVRTVARLGQSKLLGIRGLEHVATANDPFVFACNHNQRLETVLMPSILALSRNGRMVRFLADWPMKLMPPVALMYHVNRVITVTRKSARPKILNIFRPLFHEETTAFDRALGVLADGEAVGAFPEGTMNRHPTQLLRGQTGAARLALTAGVPVVPAGIRFPNTPTDRFISDTDPMIIEIGQPIAPPSATGEFTNRNLRDFHVQIMREIERLSGKAWNPKAKRRRMHAPH